MHFKRIDKRLLFYYLLPAIISLSIITFIAYNRGKEAIKEQTFNHLQFAVATAKSRIQTLIKTQKNIARELSSDRMILQNLSRLSQPGAGRSLILEEMKRYIVSRKMSLYAPDVLGVAILDNAGKVVFSTENVEVGNDRSDSGYFLKVKNSGYFGDVYYSKIFLEPVINVSAPIIGNDNSDFYGVIVSSISGSLLAEIARSSWRDDWYEGAENGALAGETKDFSSNCDIFIVNSDKKIIAGPNLANKGELDQYADTQPVKFALAKGRGMVDVYANYKGKRIIGASSFIEELQWTVLAERGLSVTFAPLFRLRAQMITLALATFGVIMLISTIMSNKLTGPVNRVIDAIHIRSKGDMDFRVNHISHDELGELATSFNQMCDDIRMATVSKEYMVKVFMGISEALIVTDKDFNIRDANPAALTMLGYDKEELKIIEFCKIVNYSEGKSINVNDLLKHNRVSGNINATYKSKAGGYIPVNLSASAIRDCKHKMHPDDCNDYKLIKGCDCKSVNIVIIARDMRSIMELVQKEKERVFELTTIQDISKLLGHTLNYNDLFKIILNSLHKAVKFDIAGSVLCGNPDDLIYVKQSQKVDDDVVAWYNDYLLKTFCNLTSNNHGNCAKEVVMLPYEEASVNAEGKDSPEQQIKSFFNVPLMIKGKVLGIINIASFQKDAFTSNHIRMLYTVANQAAISIQHLIAIIEQEKGKLASVIRDMADGVVVTDIKGVINMINPAGEKLMKLLCGEKFGDQLTRLADYSLKEPFNDILTGKKDYVSCDLALTRDFEEIIISALISSFKEGGVNIGIVIVLRDISRERKLSEQLLHKEKLSSLGEMISGIAHEINNPLAGIMGFAQILMMEPGLNNEAKDKINKIFMFSDRAKRIIQNLLTFARAHKHEKTQIDIKELVEQSFEMLEHQMMLSEVAIVKNIDPELPRITCDKYQLQQVFFNLINNAYQSLAEYHGKRMFEMSISKLEKTIVISFFNTGKGIPDKIKEKLFDPFFTTKKSGKGTGMGLSIAYGIIKEHGGSIFISEKAGEEGVVFNVELPVDDAVAAAITNTHDERVGSEPAALPVNVPKLNVLIVDDEEAITETVSNLLTMEGHVCDSAKNGNIAIEKLESHKYDIIISDIRMPELDGKQLFDYMKTKDANLVNKFIVITGEAMNPSTMSFLTDNNISYIPKPFTVEEINKVIAGVVNRQVE